MGTLPQVHWPRLEVVYSYTRAKPPRQTRHRPCSEIELEAPFCCRLELLDKTPESGDDPMTLCRIRLIACFLLALCILALSRASAQSAPWTTAVRGSWVQTGPAASGDVTLAAK